MDEPTGNIDSKTADEIVQLVKRLNDEKNVTIIMVTHDQRLAAKARRTIHMLDGVVADEMAN
jgi:ABC-type lipoprotein export system ATPase subunit